MQNRDFLRSGTGFDYCLNKIATLPADTWLISQHVEPMFRYSAAQTNRMKSEFVKRSAVFTELSPWSDINYMVDEFWSRVYPFMQEARSGGYGIVIASNHEPLAKSDCLFSEVERATGMEASVLAFNGNYPCKG